MRVQGPSLNLDNMLWLADYPNAGERAFPGRMAIIGDEGSFTYAELDKASDRFAAWLQKQGYAPGTRIAYFGRNSELLFPVLFGCIRAGCVLVPINWRFAVPEVEYVLRDSEAKLLIHSLEFAQAAQTANGKLNSPARLLPTVGGPGADTLRSIFSAPIELVPRIDQPDAVALQLYTSGTTGQPKGVMNTHRQLSAARWVEVGSPDWVDWKSDEVLLSAMPNFHSGGFSWMLIGLLRQITCICTADPSPANLLALSRKYRATRNFIVPAVVRMLVEMIESSGEEPPPYRSIFYGAAPMDVDLIQRCQRLFGADCGFAQYYGMTEMCGSVTFLPPKEHCLDKPERLRSVGRPLAGFELEIRDPDGRALGPHQAGEIFARSPTRMLGYWHQPEASAEVLLPDGWYRTGDGGYVDEKGYLFLTDRIKDMIISGAENIYPAEVEAAVRLHPAVQEVVVVGVPDAQWGETVCAVVELRPNARLSIEELREFARQRIAGYKLPRQLRVVEQLPRTATGKLQRGAVRKQLAPPN